MRYTVTLRAEGNFAAQLASADFGLVELCKSARSVTKLSLRHVKRLVDAWKKEETYGSTVIKVEMTEAVWAHFAMLYFQEMDTECIYVMRVEEAAAPDAVLD